MDKERKKVVREGKQLKKNFARSGRKTRSRRNSTQEKGIDDVLAALHLLSSSSGEDDSSQEKIMGFLPRRFRRRYLVLGMAIALKSGFAVTGVACGSTKSVLV